MAKSPDGIVHSFAAGAVIVLPLAGSALFGTDAAVASGGCFPLHAGMTAIRNTNERLKVWPAMENPEAEDDITKALG